MMGNEGETESFGDEMRGSKIFLCTQQPFQEFCFERRKKGIGGKEYVLMGGGRGRGSVR